MSHMPSLRDHERRITTLETRVDEVESCHGEAIYKMKRDLVENRLGMRMIMEHLGLPRVTPEQVDEVLDAE